MKDEAERRKIEGHRQQRENNLPLLGLDAEAPFGQMLRSDQSLSDGSKCFLGYPDTAFVSRGNVSDQRANLPPGHGTGPKQDHRD